MRHKKLKLCAVFLLVLGLAGLKAQEAMPAAGGDASGSGGSVSYSVGQVVYSTFSGTNGSVAQGVQQPYEISIVTGLGESNRINLVCSVYPNPTTDFLTLKIDDKANRQYVYFLYDINGKLVKSNTVDSRETSIDMSNLIISTYILKVQVKNSTSTQEMKTFKIRKN